MKKRFLSLIITLLCVFLCAFGLAACSFIVPVESITLNKTELVMEIGDEETLTATLLPENTTYKNVLWLSDDETVATVENGKVTAVAQGNATIIAFAGGKKATCSIIVSSGLLSQEGHDYILDEDYKFSQFDYSVVDGKDNVILLNYPCTFDLNGHELDLNGYDLTIETQEECEIVFKNGKIVGGDLKIDVPNGEITFDSVEMDDSVNTQLTAAPSTIYFTKVKAFGSLVLFGNTHMIISESDVNDFKLSGAVTVDVNDGSNIQTLTGAEESEGAQVVVAENAKVESAVLNSIVKMDIAGVVVALQVNEVTDKVDQIRIVIIVRITAVITEMTVEETSDITVDGQVGNLQVNAPSQVAVEGQVENFDVAQTAEGSDIQINENATVYNVVVNAAVAINVYGNVSLLEVAEGANADHVEIKIVIVVHITAIVTKVEISDVADVRIDGTVETVEVAPTANKEETQSNVIIGNDAAVTHMEILAAIEIEIMGEVNDIVIGEQAVGLVLDIVGEAVVSQLISDAENVIFNIEIQVVIEVIYVIDVENVTLPTDFEDIIVIVDQTVIDQMLAHRHTYTILSVKPATCAQVGKITYVCACGEQREEEIEKREHIFFEIENVPATCVNDGYITKKCAHCGEEQTTVIPAISHTLTETERTPATCTQNGMVIFTCSNCQQTFTTETGKIDHVYNVVESIAPTCTENGKLIYKCDHCDDGYEINTYGEHNYEISNTQPATCTQDGFITYECSVCHDSYDEVIPAGAGHNYVKTETKYSTAEEEGYHVYACTACGDSYTVTLPLRKEGTYILLIQNNIPWDNNVNVTLFNRLVEKEYITGWDIATATEVLSLDLSVYSSIYIANDQTTQSYNELANANAMLTEYVENGGTLIYGACDHGWAAGNISFPILNGVTKGNYYSYYNYVNNSSSYIVTGELTDNMPLTNQLLQGTYCSHTYFNEDTLPEGTDVILTDVNGKATLAQYAYGNGHVILSGLTWEFYYCRTFANGTDTTYSKNVFDDLIVYSIALSEGKVHVHEFDLGVVFQPTCTEEGYTLHTCTICGKSYKTDIVSALTHDYQISDEKEATCTSKGYVEYTCSRCGDVDRQETEQEPHDYTVNLLVMPTLLQKGSMSIVCNRCGKTVMVTLPAYNDGDYNLTVIEPAGCEQEGITDGEYIFDGVSIVVRFIIEPTGHSYVDTLYEPTCSQEGYTIHRCENCDESSRINVTPALGHSISNASCTRCGVRFATTLDGRIYKVDSDSDISNNVSLSDVLISISGTDEKGNEVNLSTTSSGGRYSINNVPYGTYTLTATLENYVTYTTSITVRTNPQTLGEILMIPENENLVGNANGYARNAATNLGISGLTVYVRAGAGNTSGEVLKTLTTSSNGYYSTESLSVGYYTFEFVDERTLNNENSRFSTGTLNVSILGGATVVNNILLNNNEAITADSIRIVLTWGSSPSDLDSHLTFGTTHIMYNNKSSNGASLDVDDTSSYGPETITISTVRQNTTYKYYVYNYSGGNISTSNAVVKVYLGNSSEPYYTFNVPTGSGRYWNVFSYNTETGFTVVNQNSSSAM